MKDLELIKELEDLVEKWWNTEDMRGADLADELEELLKRHKDEE